MTGVDGLRRLLADQARRERGRLWLSVAAGGVVASAAVALLGLSGWFITGAALAGAAGPAAAYAFNVLTPSAIIRLLAIIRTGARYVERVAGHEAGLRALGRLRAALFGRIAALPPERALALSGGEASARLVQDVDALQTLFIRRSALAGVIAGAAVSVLLAMLASPQAGAALLAVLALTVAGALALGRRIDRSARAAQARTGRLHDRVMALHAARAELRAYGLEAWAVAETAGHGEALDLSVRRAGGRAGWLGAWSSAMTGLAVAATVTAASGAAPPLAAMAALAAIVGVEAASGLAAALRQKGGADAAIRRLGELTDAPAPADPPATAPGPRLTLAGLDLAPGRALLIVGASGAGKTTLIQRLTGLQAARPSEAAIDGRDIAELAPEVRRALFSVAAQDARFLDGDVAENLRLARPDASDAELWAALDSACLTARFRSAQGLATPVGTDARRLSGGERRRLALARAYLRPAPWLVLDEPTEGLDADTRAAVLTGLAQHLKDTGQGLIVISHGADFTPLCDRTLTILGRGPDGRVRTAVSPLPAAA